MRHAFTLIELLVVITILVVLLALLTPSLDRALRQSELAVCMANLDSIGGGVLLYAAEQKRQYPYRKGVREGGGWEVARLFVDVFDDRKPLRPYVSLNGAFNDPLNDAVDFEKADPDSFGYAPYALWFGWRFDGEPGMFKLGDRFGWQGSRFNLLASDLDLIADNSEAIGAHPDDAGVMPAVVLQNQPSPYGALLPGVNIGNAKCVVSWYWGKGNHRRGLVDLNFLSDDGSVQRQNEVAWEEAIPGGNDRVTSVPWLRNAQGWAAVRVTVTKGR